MKITSEAQIYPPVSKYLQKKYLTNPKFTGYASHKDNEEENIQICLDLFDGQIIPDIYGIDNSELIYLVEGKLLGDTHAIDSAVSQALSYQRFSHFVLIALNFDRELTFFEYAKNICTSFGLGILNVYFENSELIVDEFMWSSSI